MRKVPRVGYDRDAFGSAYSSLEDEIIDALPKSGEQVYTPYTCTLFDIQPDGTAATDIEHIVALAEAYDSGLAESQFRNFAGDIDNLTIADLTVNRRQKSDLDAGEWEPPENRGWFAARVVAVKQKYGLSVDPDGARCLTGDAQLRPESYRQLRRRGDGRGRSDLLLPSSGRGSELADHDHLYQLLLAGGDLPDRIHFGPRKSVAGLVSGTGSDEQPDRCPAARRLGPRGGQMWS